MNRTLARWTWFKSFKIVITIRGVVGQFFVILLCKIWAHLNNTADSLWNFYCFDLHMFVCSFLWDFSPSRDFFSLSDGLLNFTNAVRSVLHFQHKCYPLSWYILWTVKIWTGYMWIYPREMYNKTFLMENTKNSSGLKTINWENNKV